MNGNKVEQVFVTSETKPLFSVPELPISPLFSVKLKSNFLFLERFFLLLAQILFDIFVVPFLDTDFSRLLVFPGSLLPSETGHHFKKLFPQVKIVTSARHLVVIFIHSFRRTGSFL